jgi:hypothetical protein
MIRHYLRVIAAVLAVAAMSQAYAAEDGRWSVSKSSGTVSVTSGDVQQASLKPEDNLKPGDTIRTGRDGRVLLVRGEESILIAPNSVIGLPTEQKEGLSTTIVERAGSILLNVEKRNVKHFEVETPYLAAVVKGTQFRVSVNAASTSVDVMRGQVEVTDFKSGQIAQVMPGQKATVFERGKPGVLLGGQGPFNPIEQGKPRSSSGDRIPAPKAARSTPRNANREALHALAPHSRLKISSALGEVKVDFRKVTHGLVRGSSSHNGAGRNDLNNIVGNSSPTTTANTAPSMTTAASSGSSSTSSVAGTVAAVTGAGSTNSGNGNGNRNGNGANGNGKGNGANGNGNGNGNGSNGNGNGRGNGNGGVGNGKGNGNGKH